MGCTDLEFNPGVSLVWETATTNLGRLRGQKLHVLLALASRMDAERRVRLRHYKYLAALTGGNEARTRQIVKQLCEMEMNGLPLIVRRSHGRNGSSFVVLPGSHNP